MDYMPRILTGQTIDALRRELNEELLALSQAVNEQAHASWTPALTFDTPGNLSVSYSTQMGWYSVKDEVVHVGFQIVTTSFTHTTASGNLYITGIPFGANSNFRPVGPLRFQGITKAGYTSAVVQVVLNISDKLAVTMSGSGVSLANVTAADMPTGGTVSMTGALSYIRKRR